ncbi:TonB-dependent receptor family protein [Ferruginibacter albus]|uniref:TonB-dependent receptor family protein n=1 Tax=Ferruginibacter albus TaxID=2875540 RepID=UPI001CC36EAE|nr:TonB-dependent receptor [Ferruginibacter albus]UAY51510.1 TonB-dependent receptor [Ferruginibacter albus]
MKLFITFIVSLFFLSIATAQVKQLDSVTVKSGNTKISDFTRLKDVEGTSIYAGKKTEVIVMKDVVGNKATNNSRQIYSKVAGLNIFENDGGAGIQLAIGGRGLDPNRVANFNVRQNGYDISADALGYPESYYTPPAEMTDRIEIVRGAASLQYGTQFGGMINFRLNKGSDTQKVEVISRLTGGSWNFLNSSTSIGGTASKLNYYAFFQHKSGDGWRPNADFNSNIAYASAVYKAIEKLSITLQYTFMQYLEHQPGGLTDDDFNKDPRQSVRNRNWFKVNWNLAAALIDYKISDHLHFDTRFFGLIAERDALGILTDISRTDDGTADRNLYIDNYKNWGNETRSLYTYKINKMEATALIGFRYYHGHTDRQQGYGNNKASGNADDFTFNPVAPKDTLYYSDYQFPNENIAVFAENIFRITPKLSIIPGVRFENIITRANGAYNAPIFRLNGDIIATNHTIDHKLNNRSFVIGGIGATYAVSPSLQAYFNFSQNYKAINFNDLRTLNPGLIVDSSLKDESGYSADLGIRKSNGIINYDVNIFILNYNNKIGTIPITDSSATLTYNYRTNISQSYHYGIESYIETDIWKLIKGDKAKMSISIFSNLSLINAKYKSQEAAFNNKRVEFVPQVLFKTGVAYRRNKLAISYQFSYTGDQFTDATNALKTTNAIDGLVPAYYIMDISADYKINKTFSVYASINNITNNMYFTRRADSYPGPGIIPADGRSFYTTLQVKL